jgi:hypothetical protein
MAQKQGSRRLLWADGYACFHSLTKQLLLKHRLQGLPWLPKIVQSSQLIAMIKPHRLLPFGCLFRLCFFCSNDSEFM